jgi:hypothetical protein
MINKSNSDFNSNIITIKREINSIDSDIYEKSLINEFRFIINNKNEYISKLISNIYDVFPPSVIELQQQQQETNEFYLYFLSSWEDFTTEDRISIKDFENDIYLFFKFYNLNISFENNSITDINNNLIHFHFETMIEKEEYKKKYKLENINELNQFDTEILNPLRNKTITRIKAAIIVNEVITNNFPYIGVKKQKEIELKKKELENIAKREISIIKKFSDGDSHNINFGF